MCMWRRCGNTKLSGCRYYEDNRNLPVNPVKRGKTYAQSSNNNRGYPVASNTCQSATMDTFCCQYCSRLGAKYNYWQSIVERYYGSGYSHTYCFCTCAAKLRTDLRKLCNTVLTYTRYKIQLTYLSGIMYK